MKAGTERKPENKMFKDSTKNASLLFVVFAGVCVCVCVCIWHSCMWRMLCSTVLDFRHTRTLTEEVKCVCVGERWVWKVGHAVNAQLLQTCRHWHRGMSTTQHHGDRCCCGNGAAAAWIFRANKRASSSKSLLSPSLPTAPLCPLNCPCNWSPFQ